MQVIGSPTPPAVAPAAALAETPAAKSHFLRVLRPGRLHGGLLGVVLLRLFGTRTASLLWELWEIQDVSHGEARFCDVAKRHDARGKEEKNVDKVPGGARDDSAAAAR